MTSLKTEDGRLVVAGGKSRSGKTTWTEKQVRASKLGRALAWDPEDQWSQLPGWTRVTKAGDLARMLGDGKMKVAFVPGLDYKKDFQLFCKLAFNWGDKFGPFDLIAEELADVTPPGKAIGAWGTLLRRGLKRGINIYAISQRWQEADKTAIGNASQIVMFSMLPRDQKYMSKETGIPLDELQRIVSSAPGATPVVKEFIVFDHGTGRHTKSRLRF
jgi:hypothetical protein